MNILKGDHCILRIRRAPVRQKLGTILEKKCFLQKNGLLIDVLKWFFFEKILSIFDLEN